MDYSKINDRLYVGAQIVSINDIEEATAEGITHVLDIGERPFNASGFGRLNYVWVPRPRDRAHWAGPVSLVMNLFTVRGNTVLITCETDGIELAPSLAYCVLRALGYPKDPDHFGALALLRLRRPKVRASYWRDGEKALEELGWVGDSRELSQADIAELTEEPNQPAPRMPAFLLKGSDP